jgi:hypothetical protein
MAFMSLHRDQLPFLGGSSSPNLPGSNSTMRLFQNCNGIKGQVLPGVGDNHSIERVHANETQTAMPPHGSVATPSREDTVISSRSDILLSSERIRSADCEIELRISLGAVRTGEK